MILTNWIRFSNKFPVKANITAIMPQTIINNFDIIRYCFFDLFSLLVLYKSINVVEARAFNSDAVELIAAEKITANKRPTKPVGK